MLEKIQFYICIFAALVVAVVGIMQNTPLNIMVFRLIFFIIFFYFIGLVVRGYLRRKVFVHNAKVNALEPNEGRGGQLSDEGINDGTDVEKQGDFDTKDNKNY